jgi:hypothetical protein
MDRYHPTFVLSSYRKQADGRPRVVDEKNNLLDGSEGKPYPGCYVNALVELYLTGKPNPGIRCGLVGIQFYRDGDNFGAASVASEDAFAPVEGADADDLS